MLLQMVVLCFIAVYGAISTSLFLPDYPLMKIDLNLESSVFYYSLTVYLVGAAFGHLLLGGLADQIGRFRTLSIGQFIFAGSVFALAGANSPVLVVIARFFQGFAGAVGPTIANTLCRDLFSGKDLVRSVALVFMSVTLAPVIAPLLGQIVRSYSSWRGDFIMLGVFSIFTYILSVLYLRNIPQNQMKGTFKNWIFSYINIFFSKTRLFPIFIAFFCISAAFFTFISSANFIFLDHFKINNSYFSWFLSATALSSFFGMSFLRYYAKVYSLQKLSVFLFSVGFFILSLYFSAFNIFPNFFIFFLSLCCYLSITASIAVMLISEALQECKQYSAGHVSALLGAIQLSSGACMSHISKYFFFTPNLLFYLLASFFIISFISHFIYLKLSNS